MVKVSDTIADFLKQLEIKVVFGIIGSANSHIFDSINKLNYTKIVNLHHEQACVMAMGAYYRASGKLSAALVTAGGGATNAVTGIVSNWADSIPGFILCGQESVKYCHSHSHLRMLGTQGLDIVHMTSKVVKFGQRIDDANLTQQIFENAYTETISGRPGPVLIDIPFDIQSAKINVREWNFSSKNLSNTYNLKEAYDLIKSSKRPVVVGGNGIRLSNSTLSFQKFINKFSLPTLLTWSGIDILDNQNPYYFGRFGIYGQRAANFIIQNADLVVVIGSRFAIPQVGYNFSQLSRDAKIIIVDIDEDEINKYKDYFSQVYVQSCDIFLDLMNEFDDLEPNHEWLMYCNNSKNKFDLVEDRSINEQYVNSYQFIEKLSDSLSDNHIIVTDMGTALLSGHQAISLKKNQKMFTSQGLGEMGYGLPGAIGAAFACPEKPVLCLNCDGGMMMNLQESHSIIENNLNIKIVIFNNDGYLMIKHTQKMLFKGDYNSVNKKTGIGLPNYESLMKAFGYKYYSINSMQDFNKVDDFLSDKSPSVLEVFMDPEQEFVPKVKGLIMDDGSIFAPPLEEMSPLLSLEEIKKSMLIKISERSYRIKR
jgi:acetolactate synthase-1/2/3 large subunit